MAFKSWLRRLERGYRGEMVSIPQPDGPDARFPERDLADAYLSAHYRVLGRDVPDHPLYQACRRSSDPKWRESVYTEGETVSKGVPDLSE